MAQQDTYADKFKSFCITVRPKAGLHGSYAEAIEKYIRKQKYFVYNYEKEDEARHIHAQIFFDDPVRKSNIQTALKRIAEKHDENWNPASRKVLVSGVKIAYSDNFMDNYITKDSEVEMLNWNPPVDTEPYYPTKEEQEKVKAKANAKDQYFHRLSELWNEKNKDYIIHINTLKDIGLFIYDQMFVDKTIPVVRDDRQRKQIVKAAMHYIYPYNTLVNSYMFTQEDLNFFENNQN